MHLARRGGRRSENEILANDIDGHVQNLRASLTAEELKYKDKDKGKGKWIPKAGGAVPCLDKPIERTMSIESAAQPDCEDGGRVSDADTRSASWRTTVLHADFVSFYFTFLEDDARALAQLSDEWVQRPNDSLPQELLPKDINTDHKTIDDWWANGAPTMHPTIIPFVRNYMLSSAIDCNAEPTEPQLGENCLAGLRLVIKDGCKADEQYARAAMLLTEQPIWELIWERTYCSTMGREGPVR